MRDEVFPDMFAQAEMHRRSINELARHSLQLCSRTRTAQPSQAIKLQYEQVADAYMHHDGGMRHQLLAHLREQGVTERILVDELLPGAARVMGERWANNEASFVDVTIGGARMNETLRSIAARRADIDQLQDAPSMLLAASGDEDHTLGILVAADHFRSIGIEVDMVVGAAPADLARRLETHNHGALGFSVAGNRGLNWTKNVLSALKPAVRRRLPVVIGGCITISRPVQDILEATGVDHVCSDPREAVSLCGLIQP
ncbi:MAG: cobalamin B12-binding domain-containing protein [Rhodobacteraceae bacterium]|nr:cobalamin B12-binding domain-containing protein [Paracoccaceae bacterium]